MGIIPGGTASREPFGSLLLTAQTCRLGREFSLGMGVWVTGFVILVVHFVRSGVLSATAHLRKGHLPAPGDDDMVDVDGIVAVPEDLLINPKKPPVLDEGFDKAHHMPDGEARHGSETLIGNLGVLAKHIGFGEDGVENDAFGAGNLDTAEDSS